MRILDHVTLLSSQGIPKSSQAILIEDGLITWCGNRAELPLESQQLYPTENCQNKLVTPGLIDCHTHLVYAGNRADEFRQRQEGVSYTEIAKAGGGILSTVRHTRAATEEELLHQSLPRLLSMQAEGVTTVEIKSGYGLDRTTEIKMLRVAKQLGQLTGLRVMTTFLGAHALPPEFRGRADEYISFLCEELLPELVELELVDAVDVFCETIGFTLAQSERLFLKASELGIPVKCHAEQLSNMGASHLAANYGALSCDHLEYLDEKGAEALFKTGTVAVLLPGAFYFLRETVKPPIKLLQAMGVPMAIATDCNPGSSPTTSLSLMMSMASQFFGLTVPEVWQAVTVNAAKALGLADKTGRIQPGMLADLVCWETTDSASPCYYFGNQLPHKTMINGQWIKDKS